MKLNFNFNGLTKLKEWWQVILSNLKIIEAEVNSVQQTLKDSCTKTEAKQYIAELAGATPEYMAAIEAFSELYQQNSSSAAALEELSGKRLRYFAHRETFDVNTALTEDIDSIHFCRNTTLNSADGENGILLSMPGYIQIWYSTMGNQYYRLSGGEWTPATNDMLSDIEKAKQDILALQTSKSEIVFGTYTGNGTTGRIINLGFKPVAVEIYRSDGYQAYYDAPLDKIFGGLVLRDNPLGSSAEIVENGFVLNDEKLNYASGSFNYKYYFIAYKNGAIMSF